MQAAGRANREDRKEGGTRWEPPQAGSHCLRWGVALSAAEAVLGQLLSMTVLLYLEGPTAALGLLLGILITANGCLGVAGCTFRDLNQLTGHIVGALLCACLTFGYVVQVANVARVDCALAQLRGMNERAEAGLQRALDSRQRLLSAVQLRLQALDSTVSLLADNPSLVAAAVSPPRPAAGAAGSTAASLQPGDSQQQQLGEQVKQGGWQLPLRKGGNTMGSSQAQQAKQELLKAHAREVWRAADAHFIERKLKELREHGMKVLDHLFRETSEGRLKELQDRVADQLTEDDRREMEDRFGALFTAVTQTLHNLEAHLSEGEQLTPAQLEELVGRLEGAMAGASAYIREMEQVLGAHGGSPISHYQFQALLHGLDLNATSSSSSSTAAAAAAGGTGPAAGALGRPLQGMRDDLVVLKEAMARGQREQGYEQMHIPDATKVKKGWRWQWDSMMEAAAEAEQEGEEGLLEHLVQQCVEAQRGERLLVRAALALVAVQAACAYAVWGAAVQQAEHHRHWE